MMIYELSAIYDSRASFYGKAKIAERPNTILLYSYDTLILGYNKKTKKITFFTDDPAHFTQTTNRHINEFFKQFTNETSKTRKQLLQMARG